MYTLIHNLFFYYVALFETLALITISVQNPIHAILSLMGCFFAGSILLATLNLDYFALLFLIVYVGAIVVLFLFIIMFMDLKMTHIKLNLKALFNLYTWTWTSFLIVFLYILQSSDTSFQLSQFFENGVVGEVPLIESNIYVDFGELLREEQQRLLTVLGLFLFNHCFAGIYLAAILLFISMIGAIVITKDTREIITTKNQEGGFQVLISK